MIFQDCSALSVAIQSVTADQCATLLQQVRRSLIQRTGNTAITAVTALTLGTWTPLLAAADSTKITSIRSLFYSPSIGGSEAVKVGSNDNSTPAGRSQVVGETVPTFKGMFTGLSPVSFSDIRKLFAEGNSSADFDRLGAYLVCGDDQLLMHKSGGPIPIHSPFIGNPAGGELHKLTEFAVEWEFDKEWYSNVVVLKLPFNPSLLVNPAA